MTEAQTAFDLKMTELSLRVKALDERKHAAAPEELAEDNGPADDGVELPADDGVELPADDGFELPAEDDLDEEELPTQV